MGFTGPIGFSGAFASLRVNKRMDYTVVHREEEISLFITALLVSVCIGGSICLHGDVRSSIVTPDSRLRSRTRGCALAVLIFGSSSAPRGLPSGLLICTAKTFECRSQHLLSLAGCPAIIGGLLSPVSKGGRLGTVSYAIGFPVSPQIKITLKVSVCGKLTLYGNYAGCQVPACRAHKGLILAHHSIKWLTAHSTLSDCKHTRFPLSPTG